MKQKQKTLWGVPVKLWRVLLIVSVTLMTELIVAGTTPTPSSQSSHSVSQLAVPAPTTASTSLNANDDDASSSEHVDESSSEIVVMSYITAVDDTTNVDDLVVDCAASISGTAEVHIPEIDAEEEADTSKDGRMLFPPEWWGDTRMSYMDYRTITDPSSDQWRLQQKAVTDPVTGIRTVNGRYCVAVGSAISMTKGAYIDVTLQNGVRIPCVLADCKRDCDTIDTFVGADGGIVEFVVDATALPNQVQLLGSNEAQFNGYWASPVAKIFVWDESSNGYYDWD
jgi:hypothetical protein